MLKEIRYAVVNANHKKDRHLVRLNKDGTYHRVCGVKKHAGLVKTGYVLAEVGCTKCLASHEYRVVKKYGKRDLSQRNVVLRT